MSVARRGTKPAPAYSTVTVKSGVLAGATYPEQTYKDAATGEDVRDARAGLPVASIAAALEYGARQNHPRPFMQVTAAREKRAWADNVAKLVRSGMSTRDALLVVGQTMKEDVQQTIREWPADNSPEWASVKGFNHGLIQTSHLLNSIESAIEDAI